MGYSYKSSRNSSVASKYSRSGTGQRRSPNRGNRGAGQYIDPARFVKVASVSEAEEYVPMHKFTDFEIDELLQRNLKAKGYETPSPIQDQAIPIGLSGQDIIGIASTGTGKTAAFALPLLNRLLTDRTAAALIIAPTRELAQQIEAECQELAKGSNLFGALLIGGSSMSFQLRALQRRPRIVIGTPGRIKDHLTRGSLKLIHTDMIVLDEVDRMLDMGFLPDVREILSNLKQKRQSYFFSATMDTRIRTLIESFTNNPVTISLKASTTNENIHQNVVGYTGNTEKMDKLHDLLISGEVAKAIVFDETQRGVERLSKELIERGFKADSIHGGKSQGQRQRALSRFKKSEVSILVATDVAARGIDVIDITHVINYSIPKVYDDYIHRIGRAGRAGRTGHALTFVEAKSIQGIQR
jgi:ATP-dependent RNA helicase RhlE